MVGGAAYVLAKDRLLGWSAFVGAWWLSIFRSGARALDRYVAAPSLALVDGVEAPALDRGENRLGLSLMAVGRELRRVGASPPVVPLLFILTLVVVLIAALATPGLAR